MWLAWMVFCLVTQYNRHSYMQANTILLYILFYQILESNLNDKRIHQLYNVIGIVVLAHALWVWMQFFDIWYLYHLIAGYSGHIPGVMGESNSAGSLLALGVPVLLRKKWWIGLPFILGAMLHVGNFTSIAVVSGGLGLYVLIKLPKWRIPLIACIIAGFCFYVYKYETVRALSKGQGRFETWKLIWKVARLKPVKGFGVGQYRVVFPQLDLKVLRAGTKIAWFRAHNEPLELMFNQGLVSVGLIFGFIFSSIERFLKNKTELGFIAFIGVVISVVSCFGHFLAHITPFMISIIYMACMTSQIREEKDETGKRIVRWIGSHFVKWGNGILRRCNIQR